MMNITKMTVVSLVLCFLLPNSLSRYRAKAAYEHLDSAVESILKDQPYVPGRLLVKFRPAAYWQLQSTLLAMGGKRLKRRSSKAGIEIIELAATGGERALAQALRSRPDVEYAELDYIFSPQSMSADDPLYASAWHLPAISCPAAWEMTTGSSGVTLALCDTGVDSAHPDLAPRLVAGWNVVEDNSDTSPLTSHGTLVAGVAAATSNNAQGVAAPDWNCKIMPVRVASDQSGSATLSDIAEGIIWAADHGAQVVNVSYAAGSAETVREAARYLQSKGGILVMPAGNNGFFLSDADSPSVFITGSTSATDSLASFSNSGPFVDLAAPGTSIWTTGLNGTYAAATGSSFSSPLVASVAALMFSVNPDLEPARIDALLKLAADDLGPQGWDPGYGWGKLNAARAVELAQSSLMSGPDNTAPAMRFLQPHPFGSHERLIGKSLGELVAVEALDDREIAEVLLFADGVLVGSDTAAPYNFHWNTSDLEENSQHSLTAVAHDAAGNTTQIAMTAVVTTGFDLTPPQVVITSPKNGTNVIRNVRVEIEAWDNSERAIALVELYVNGRLVFTADSVTSFEFTLPQGETETHTLVCKAYDWVGNVGSSEAVTIRSYQF